MFYHYCSRNNKLKSSNQKGAVKNPMDGATTIINCAVNPALESVGGVYYQDCQPASTTSVARLPYYFLNGNKIIY